MKARLFYCTRLPFLLAACGQSTPHAAPDAMPDAVCALACGATCCTPAADCASDACACPAAFVPAMPTFVTGVVVQSLPQLDGLSAAIGQFDQDGERDAILIAYDPTAAPVGVDVDLATATNVRAGFGYQIDANQQVRGSFRATRGTLHLTAACDVGAAGTLTGATLEEIDIFKGLTPLPGGCTFDVASVTFAVAKECP